MDLTVAGSSPVARPNEYGAFRDSPQTRLDGATTLLHPSSLTLSPLLRFDLSLTPLSLLFSQIFVSCEDLTTDAADSTDVRSPSVSSVTSVVPPLRFHRDAPVLEPWFRRSGILKQLLAAWAWIVVCVGQFIGDAGPVHADCADDVIDFVT